MADATVTAVPVEGDGFVDALAEGLSPALLG